MMSYQPNPRQALCIFGMLFGRTEDEREPMQSKVKPELKPKDRRPLVEAGLLEAQKRGNATHLVPTDAAWAWAGAHLDAPLMESKQASRVLHNVLGLLRTFLEQREAALADLALAAAQPDERSTGTDAATSRTALPAGNEALRAGVNAEGSGQPLPERIRQTLWELAGGRTKARVRLAELRERLGGVPRQELDSLLLEMQDNGRLVLYPLDNPVELTAADRGAALLVGQNPRHLVYLES